MIRKVALAAIGLSALMALTACKSKHESSGDKFLEMGDPINAVARYDMAIREGKTSGTFYDNYTKANILIMERRFSEDPSAEFLDELNNIILDLLNQHPNPENSVLYSKTLYNVAMARINMADDYTVEKGFAFLKTADSLPNRAPEVSSGAAQAREQYAASRLAEVESDLAAALAGDASSGIIADYKMNILHQVAGSTPASEELWSKVRQANLDTYLMYDQEGLLPSIDARINRYGVLLALTKHNRTPGKLYVETMAYNGSSQPFTFDGDKFVLVDKEGNQYAPAAKKGGFSKDKKIDRGQQTAVGALTFNYPKEAQLDYIEFQSESGLSRKYLP